MQSWVAYGHVGNAAALFPLQRLGAEVWAVNTVQFSNHPGYGDVAGTVFEPEAIDAQLQGIERRGAFARLDAVLSGYLGHGGTGEAVLRAVARARAMRPDLLYACDPVMGDAGALYVRPEVASLLQGPAVSAADILSPNLFELGLLQPELDGFGRPALASVARAANALRGRMRPGGPALVLVTSVLAAETPDESIDLLLATAQGCLLIRTPRLALRTNGAGDLTSALFLRHMLALQDPREALERTTASVWGVLRRTQAAGEAEPLIIAAQQELVAPSRLFGAVAM